MLRSLFVTLLVSNTLLLADDKVALKVPTWSLSPTAAAQLAKDVDGGWFSIRPPKKYLRAELDLTAYKNSGIKVAAWTRKSDREIQPAITIMSIPAPRVPAKNNQVFFNGILKSLTKRWPNARGAKTVQGRWNGRMAYRYEFTATSNKDKLSGIVLAEITPRGTFVVSAAQPTNTREDRDAFQTLKSSVISCKRK
jgi:hypothetical protein